MIKKLLAVFVIQISSIGITYCQFKKSIFMFGDLDVTIHIHKAPQRDSLKFEMTAINGNCQSIFMGSLSPRIRWSVDSSLIEVYWGEDRKFWRESEYPLSELKSEGEYKTTILLPDPQKNNLTVSLVGQYILSFPPKDRKNLSNRDLQEYESFKSFHFMFNAIVDRSNSVDDITN
jgi:hypothetical protein